MINAEAPVKTVSTVGTDTVAVEIETPAGFEAHPGQFVKVTAFVDGEHVSRFYTLSSPDVADTFEVTVEIEPDGTLGPWLADAGGKTVRVEGPYGQAYYDGQDDTLVIAGGPGIGPAVGIGERAVADGNAVAIVFRGAQPPHEDRLTDLEEHDVSVAITDDLQPAIAPHLSPETQLLVYGFQSFVTEALNAIEAAGGDPDRAKVENYG